MDYTKLKAEEQDVCAFLIFSILTATLIALLVPENPLLWSCVFLFLVAPAMFVIGCWIMAIWIHYKKRNGG